MEKMGFVDYFLIVQDFINWAKQNGCPVGPGRGSAAGSLVAYCIGITDIDPIKYDLLFERFLNPDRVSMPDIDVDFCEANRWKAIDYVRKKYGEKNVCQIITFGTLKAKAVIRDVGRVLDVPLPEVDKIAKLIPEGPKVTLESALAESPDLAKLREEPAYRRLFDLGLKLEGVNRHAGKHAAGVVISDQDLLERIPLTRVGSGEDMAVTTQYTMTEVEEAGLLKMDFLGLRTLTLITDCLNLIKQIRGVTVDEDKIPIDDKKAFELLARGETRGVFQLESSGFRELLIRSKPDRFEDIVALLALYRPGPLGSGMDVQFVNRKHGREPISYDHPLLEPILNETYGCFLYQEQVMRVANKVAGFTLAEADTLRKAMGKKKVDLMEKFKAKFVAGCVKNTVPEATATTLWDTIVKFAEYGFNKSHSAAYGLVTYRTAYLKANYPAEFMAATLTSWSGDTEKLVEYVDECKRMGLPVLAPDVNSGGAQFSVQYVKKAAKKGETPKQLAEIVYGLEAIRGMGSAAVAHIVEARGKANGRFRSIFHFCDEVDAHVVNRATLEALVKAGAFHTTGARRSQLSAVLEQAIQIGAQTQKDRLSKQVSLFGGPDASSEEAKTLDSKLLPEIPEWKDADLLAREKEALGFYLSSHPLEPHRETIERFSTAKTADLAETAAETMVTVGGIVTSLRSKPDKRGNLMAFVTLEDFSGTVDGVVFGSVYPEVRDQLKVDAPVFLQGKLDKSRESPSIRVDAVIPAAEAEGKLRVCVAAELVVEDTTEAHVLKLRDLFNSRKGDDSVFYTFKRRADGASAGPFKVGAHMRVSGNDALRRDMLELLGPTASVRIGAQVVATTPRG
jgi:DNA polymerase-3 subunit alpha